jgi:hypothetical protein
MKIVGEEFESQLSYLYNAWLPAKQFVEEAVANRWEVHPSGKIIEFSRGYVPWKEHFFGIEKELNLSEAGISLVLYQDETAKSWRVQVIPVSENSGFENRYIFFKPSKKCAFNKQYYFAEALCPQRGEVSETRSWKKSVESREPFLSMLQALLAEQKAEMAPWPLLLKH